MYSLVSFKWRDVCINLVMGNCVQSPSSRWNGWVISSWGVLKTRETTRSSSVIWPFAIVWQTSPGCPALKWSCAASQTLSLDFPESSLFSGAKMPKTRSSLHTAPLPERWHDTSSTTPEKSIWIWRWVQIIHFFVLNPFSSIFHWSLHDRWGKGWDWKAGSWKNTWKRTESKKKQPKSLNRQKSKIASLIVWWLLMQSVKPV